MAQDTTMTDAQELQTTLVAHLKANASAKDTFCKCCPCKGRPPDHPQDSEASGGD